ncbi:MAG: iron-sulfur cluster carrier protein MrpORP [Lentisphaeria bacterium]|jgi:Mrp family chromosome partitioning ATPase/predicted Fe-Mo cluster-binding NifX family protein
MDCPNSPTDHHSPCVAAPLPGENAAERDEGIALRQRRLGRIAHKIIVLSGKGGVGKSTIGVNLAVAIAMAGRRVGLLDVDIHGPSIPTMLNLKPAPLRSDGHSLLPVEIGGLKVMSIGLLLDNRDAPVIWRGPRKTAMIQQFLQDVEWGELDYLIIDAPPGTGDEPLSVCQLLGDGARAVIVTTPQEVAAADVRKSLNFCRQLNLPVLGVVENMSGFACPHCAQVTDIFSRGGGAAIAAKFAVPFLGRIPIDPAIAMACDEGTPFIHRFADSATANCLKTIISPILALTDTAPTPEPAAAPAPTPTEAPPMKIAIPIANGRLTPHFGHCAQFALLEVDPATQNLIQKTVIDAPPHEPGLLPRWLAGHGVGVIIAGGMGQRAQSLFAEQRIIVRVGAPAETPEALALAFLDGSLQTGANACDH